MNVPAVCTECRPTPLEQAAAARATSHPATAKPGDPARVSEPFSPSGTAVAARGLAASPPVDAGKVERLRAAIADGSYTPDPAAIAAKMIALDLPGK